MTNTKYLIGFQQNYISFVVNHIAYCNYKNLTVFSGHRSSFLENLTNSFLRRHFKKKKGTYIDKYFSHRQTKWTAFSYCVLVNLCWFLDPRSELTSTRQRKKKRMKKSYKANRPDRHKAMEHIAYYIVPISSSPIN